MYVYINMVAKIIQKSFEFFKKIVKNITLKVFLRLF